MKDKPIETPNMGRFLEFLKRADEVQVLDGIEATITSIGLARLGHLHEQVGFKRPARDRAAGP